jgi:AcrR family transcriptional regulator
MSIIDAAGSVFCREGYAGANIDLIAAEAGVSRQTVYNHHRDKEKLFVAVVRDLTERCNAGIFATIATFPDQPKDLEADLVGFAVRMNRNCICNRDGRFLRKLIQAEGERYPELFADWREQGPGRTWPAIAARFARLAHGGYLTIDDPDVAARQFVALVNAELQTSFMLGITPGEEEVLRSARNGVRTFLRAYGKRHTVKKPELAAV